MVSVIRKLCEAVLQVRGASHEGGDVSHGIVAEGFLIP